jgi:hypothetical protein
MRHRGFGFARGERVVGVRDVRVIRRLFVVPGIMEFRRFAVVSRRKLVVCGGIAVVIGSSVCHLAVSVVGTRKRRRRRPAPEGVTSVTSGPSAPSAAEVDDEERETNHAAHQ